MYIHVYACSYMYNNICEHLVHAEAGCGYISLIVARRDSPLMTDDNQNNHCPGGSLV